MIISISVAIIAMAFVVLVIFLVKTLKAVQGTMEGVSKTLAGIEKQLDEVTKETALLLHKTNVLADDIQEKAESLNSVVVAVKGVGSTVNKFNHSLRSVATSFDQQVEQNKDKISQVVQWSNILLELKDKWKAKREEKKANSDDEKREIELQRLRSHS
ncbi:DUF948 domain-containing protein [Bacillus sp. CGMCC 1.16607]|uniref:DUF948 domain-containing protein n=1 Tax=Bacillus sp. CGMCC 1.16607 TaxID=3351842 RepID=UPI003640E2A0